MNYESINETANRLLAQRIGEMVMSDVAQAAHAQAMAQEIERLQALAAEHAEAAEAEETPVV